MKANEVRIIGGVWRSRRIRFPGAANLRPTPDRVRETLFNWLGQDLTGLACLDLFAGSGALGFEAASRGAQRVVMVEHDRAAHAALGENRAALAAGQVELVRADALEFLRQTDGQHQSERQSERQSEHQSKRQSKHQSKYDVIFLDPPFAADHWIALARLLPPHLTESGRVYCESGVRVQWPAGWTVEKESRAGEVEYQLVTWTEPIVHEHVKRSDSV